MTQQVLQNLKCSKEGHYDEIDSVCYNQLCTEFRLNCFQCIKKGSHNAHLDDVQKTHTLLQYIENQNKEYEYLINDLNKLQESVSQSLFQFKKGISQKYSLLKEILVKSNSQQINDILNLTIQFTEYKQSITTIISDQVKNLTHAFNNLYNQLQIQSFNYYEISDSDTQQSQQLYNEGEQLYNDDKYQESIKLLDKAIQLDPNNYNALWCKGDENNQLLLGDCLKMLDRFEDAIPWFDKTLSINPKHVGSLCCKGSCLRKLNRFEDAILLYDKALTIDPKNLGALCCKGESLRQLKRFNDSLKYLDQALSLDPNDISSLQSKGLWLEDQGKYQEALILYKKILAINPSDQWTMKEKTLCESKLKK